MKYRTLKSAVPLAVAVAAGWIGATLTQGTQTAQAQAPAAQPPQAMPTAAVAVWNYPDSADSVNAAPKNHYVLFEDDHIRMVQVIIQPGETEKMHGHRYPSVFFRDTVRPGQNDTEMDKDGKPGQPRVQARMGEDRVYPSAFAMPMAQGLHQTTITDTFPDVFYRVEFKKLIGKDIMSMTSYPYPKVKRK